MITPTATNLAISALELDAEEFELFLRSLAARMEISGEEIIDQSGDRAMANSARKVFSAASEWCARSGN